MPGFKRAKPSLSPVQGLTPSSSSLGLPHAVIVIPLAVAIQGARNHPYCE